MNELNKIAHQVAEAKYKLNEDKLLFNIYKEEIVENEINNLINMGWETNRTSSQQPIEIQNYVNNNR
ncbi:hypothetical protein [Empedobacter stercoris]|uniref:hypothetical protein n=1 Tax=Empedobacter stercoris TaxID=1628248 RepID=UPI0039E8BFE9